MQFKAAYKRILVHNEAVGSIFGNCSIMDNTKNLSVTEKAKDSVLTLESTWLPQQNIYIDHDYFENYTKISSFVEDTSMYNGGFIVKKLFKKIECESCQKCLIQQSDKNPNSLTKIKNRGGLLYPSKAVEVLCQESEKIFRSESPLYFNQSKNKLYLINKVKTNIYNEGKETIPYCTEQESFLNRHAHRENVMNLIINKYVDIRIFHEIRKIKDSIKEKRTRTKLTKLIHFNHE